MLGNQYNYLLLILYYHFLFAQNILLDPPAALWWVARSGSLFKDLSAFLKICKVLLIVLLSSTI